MYASNGELTDAIYDFDDWCFAPTIAEVIDWLYEKHGVWISVLHKRRSENKYFDYEIKLPNGMEIYSWDHNSPTEAGEAAIEYTLNELI